MDFKKIFILFLFFTFISKAQFSSISVSDSVKVYQLSEIVKTATRTNMSTLELANSITVIDSNEISSRKKNNVYELLQSEYGISFTQQGGPGKLNNVYSRGGNTGHTLILLDGIEMNMPNDPANTFDFSHMAADNIERIEILRGPQSTLYGSDALAGVINIITKKGSGKTNLFLNSEGGTYNTYKFMGGIGGSLSLFNYSATVSRYGTDGFSSASEDFGNTEKDGHKNLTFSSRIGADINENIKTSLIYHFTQSETDYDQFGGFFGDDPTYIFDLEENALRFETEMNFFDNFYQTEAGISYLRNVRKYRYDSTLNNPSSSKSIYDGRKTKFDWLNNFKINNNNVFTLGFETEKEEASSEYFIYSSAFPFQSIIPSHTSFTTGVFAQHQLSLFNSVFNTIGVRYDNHEKFGSAVTFRIAPAFMIWQTGTKLKATYGTGFKAPSLFYLYDPAFGNLNLKPEKSEGWDAGFEQFFWDLGVSFGATYFYNNFRDLFGFDNNFITVNINEAATEGIEIFFTYFPDNSLKINSSYTYTGTKDKSENSVDSNLPLLRRPEHKLTLNSNYNLSSKTAFNFEIIYIGERDDKDFSQVPAARIILNDYTLLNFAVTQDFFNFISLYGRVENILDKKYQEVFGYASPGRSFYAGIKLKI